MDDEFAGDMQRVVYERRPEWIVGSVLSKNAIYKKSPVEAAVFVLRRSGLRYLVEMTRMKVFRRIWGRGSITTPSVLAQRCGVTIFESGNINDDASLQQLQSWQPDLVISTNFSHYIGAKARAIARIGTWNLHKSYLPNYRGMAPSFYALLHGEREVGATLHVVDSGFDTGDIVRQVHVPVQTTDTVYSLNKKTSQAGGQLLAKVLEEVSPEGLPTAPQPDGNWKSFSYPSSEDIRQFLSRGLKF